METKQRASSRRAQIAEAAVLLIAVQWATWTVGRVVVDRAQSNARHQSSSASDALRAIVPRVLLGVNIMAVGVVIRGFVARAPVPRALQALSRQERDDGLVIGCILPPLVLLSRLAVEYCDQGVLSASSLLYAWSSTSIGMSVLLKIVCLPSQGLRSILLIDGLLLPVLFSIASVEAGARFLLPTACRCLVGLLFHYGRAALPRSFTIGEALLVAQGVGIAAFDLLLATVKPLNAITIAHLSTRFSSAWRVSGLVRDDFVLAMEIGVLGGLVVCAALTPILQVYGASSPHVISPPLALKPSVWFAAIVGSVVLLVVYPWSCLLLQTWNPAAWLVCFLVEDARRWQLILYWLGCLILGVPICAWIVRGFALRQIIARKLFHALVVVMFVPAYSMSPSMLALSYGVALTAFCLMECIRAVSLPPVGHRVAVFVKDFIDRREGGRVILTHIYLLLGCALPLWLTHSYTPRHALAANAGILALGVGDAMGAIIGSSIGRRKLFGSKTWEGTIAVLVSMTLASSLFQDRQQHAHYVTDSTRYLLLIGGLALTSLLEAATAQIDNLVLSLFLFTIANLVACL